MPKFEYCKKANKEKHPGLFYQLMQNEHRYISTDYIQNKIVSAE